MKNESVRSNSISAFIVMVFGVVVNWSTEAAYSKCDSACDAELMEFHASLRKALY